MASILEQLQIKYKSRQVDKTEDAIKTSLTYQGSKELCEQFMESNPPGTVDGQYGTIESLKMSQDEGIFWNVEVQYTIDTTNSSNTGGNNSAGPQQSVLNMSMTSIPIESYKTYKCIWNNILFSTKAWNTMTSGEKSAAETIIATAGRTSQGEIDDKITGTSREYDGGSDYTNAFFCWGKAASECPSLNVPEGDPKQAWFVIRKMSKPGIESVSYPVYSITERSKNVRKRNAGWALTKKAGHISDPVYGDFGLKAKYPGAEFLCEGGSISFDGRYWITERTYTMSPDVIDGWDRKPLPKGMIIRYLWLYFYN